MSELNLCPFCGNEPMKRYGYDIHKVGCSNVNCDIYEVAKYPEEWNSIGSTLKERVKELEKLADALLWKCVECDSDVADSDAWHELERKIKSPINNCEKE